MKRSLNLFAIIIVLVLPMTSCGGGGAKAVKALQKVCKSSGMKKTGQTIVKHGDDVARHISSKTVTCTTCAGLKQVDYVDDYGKYLYTGDCPECDGKGTITKYEFK